MEIFKRNSDIIMKDADSFNLRHIFDCGQCFRFNKVADNTYTGVAKNRAITVSQNGNEVIFYHTSEEDFYNIWYDYFDLNTNYSDIKNSLATDTVMKTAISYGNGIRILNQDLWEMIISFIISASNNIPRIKGIIERLCSNFGEEITYMGNTYYAFPTIEKMSTLSIEDIGILKAGFRDKYIFDAISKISTGELCLDTLKTMSSYDAKKALMSIHGVGNKVSDCILLFGLNKADSFPVDVWIKRIMEYIYFNETEQPIEKISQFATEKFGNLGGYAQQYLFFYARENKIGL